MMGFRGFIHKYYHTGDILTHTHPETVVHVWDVLFGSQRPTVPQTLLELLDLNIGQTEVTHICLKVDLWLAIFGPSG